MSTKTTHFYIFEPSRQSQEWQGFGFSTPEITVKQSF